MYTCFLFSKPIPGATLTLTLLLLLPLAAGVCYSACCCEHLQSRRNTIFVQMVLLFLLQDLLRIIFICLLTSLYTFVFFFIGLQFQITPEFTACGGVNEQQILFFLLSLRPVLSASRSAFLWLFTGELFTAVVSPGPRVHLSPSSTYLHAICCMPCLQFSRLILPCRASIPLNYITILEPLELILPAFDND